MVSDHPLQATDVVNVMRDAGFISGTDDEVSAAIDNGFHDLAKEYSQQGRGFELHHNLQGWQLVNAVEYEQIVAHFITEGQTARLSQAALEALAIIAYKQPITRAQVSAIRGVSSDGVIRSLTVRGLIREQGSDEQTHAALLVTTGLFLDKMGVQSLEELPSLAPFLPESVIHDADMADDINNDMNMS
ncbi:SMC-Scp complex subunit ScpB [Alloscardovia omnicolens]